MAYDAVRGEISHGRMQWGQAVFLFLAYGVAGTLLGISLVPALLLVSKCWQVSAHWPWIIRMAGLGFCAGWGYFLFGVTLLCTTALFCKAFCRSIREGNYPFFSLAAAQWVFSYVMALVVQTFFINFMRSTPLICWWYRQMGARIGQDVQINSPHLNDAPLLSFQDSVLIGANSLLICHGTQNGALRLRKTEIGRGAAIGAGAVLMPGVKIGARAIILPGSVVPSGTQILAGEVWGGVPAECVKPSAARAKVAA